VIGGSPLRAVHQTPCRIVLHFNIGRGKVEGLSPARMWNMEREIIFLVEEAPEGGYMARALEHTICTEADSLAKLKEMVREATRCHFEAREMPRVIRLRTVKDEVIPI
jgi:hypothetical protein